MYARPVKRRLLVMIYVVREREREREIPAHIDDVNQNDFQRSFDLFYHSICRHLQGIRTFKCTKFQMRIKLCHVLICVLYRDVVL